MTSLAAGWARTISIQNAAQKLYGQLYIHLYVCSRLRCPSTIVPMIGPMADMIIDMNVTHTTMLART